MVPTGEADPSRNQATIQNEEGGGYKVFLSRGAGGAEGGTGAVHGQLRASHERRGRTLRRESVVTRSNMTVRLSEVEGNVRHGLRSGNMVRTNATSSVRRPGAQVLGRHEVVPPPKTSETCR